jgi:glycosyltransferase involved in cell wall biosynthesis
MKLSVILIAYDMAREIPRTLQGLARTYQTIGETLDYEVLLIDNGSPEPLDPASFEHIDVPVKLIRIDNAHASPAQAINYAAEQAQGELLCLMIDGAHLITPGVFDLALSADRAFSNAVSGVRYFFLGPDEQNISINQGYSKDEEDRLLEKIQWPNNGYDLFDIGSPLRAGAQNITWFNRMFEANCLFLKRELFVHIGGVDESFDSPGGGFLNLDLYKRACDAPGVVPVQLVGEGTFHQLHGGTTTNVSMEKRVAKTEEYRQQYRAIRGHDQLMTDKDVHFLGHLPTQGSKIHLKNRQ